MGLVGATVLVIVILGWTLVRFSSAHDALNRAQSHGSDSVEVLSSARILTLLAQNNENLALVERGSGDVYVAEFEQLMTKLGGNDGHGGLLREAALVADRTGEGNRIRQLATPFADAAAAPLRRAHLRRSRRLQRRGRALGGHDRHARPRRRSRHGAGPTRSSTRSTVSTANSRATSRAAQARLLGAATDARQGYGVLEIAIPVLAILAGLLVLLGLERRIAEYR